MFELCESSVEKTELVESTLEPGFSFKNWTQLLSWSSFDNPEPVKKYPQD